MSSRERAQNRAQYRLKHMNRRAVLEYIRANRSATKAGLSQVTGLTFMAIKKIFAELEGLDLIREDVQERGGVGRRATTFTINEQYGYTIGIYINIYRTSVGLLDLHGTVLAQQDLEMAPAPEDSQGFVDSLAVMAEQVIRQAGVARERILGVGVSVPGPIDAERGIVLMPPNLKVLHYLPLQELLEQRLQQKVFLQKDTNAVALGEYWHGLGRGYADIAYIDIDMGIGSGLVIGGELYEGAAGVAGEFGHMTLDIAGPPCNCGNRGCLEVLGSGLALLKAFGEAIADDPGHELYARREALAIGDLIGSAAGGDSLAMQLLHSSAQYVGAALRNLINLLDPQLIILGGVLITEYPAYYHIVRDAAVSRRIRGAYENVMLKAEVHREAGVVGAGEIVADHFYRQVVAGILAGA